MYRPLRFVSFENPNVVDDSTFLLSRLLSATPSTVVRKASTNDLNAPQLVDPTLRGGEALFPNLMSGREGVNAIATDPAYRKAYLTGQMFRPQTYNLNRPEPPKIYSGPIQQEMANKSYQRRLARYDKAVNDVQFSKAGQSPGQAKELEVLIRQNPEIASSFNVGIGSSLNKEQMELQEQGLPYNFDPTNEKWRSGFTRKRDDIIPMSRLQWALSNSSEGIMQDIEPSATKLQYTTQLGDVNDPQRFFNLLPSKANINYDGIIEALESLPTNNPNLKEGKKDHSLGYRYHNRVKDYTPHPDNRVTWVENPDKPYQTIDEIIADVDQIESPYFSPQFADNRIQRSLSSTGNQDLNNIPKDYTRKAYLEAMGDSDNLPDLPYSEYTTTTRLFGNLVGDKRGDYIPKYQLTDESNLIGREIGNDNVRIAYEANPERLRLAKLARAGKLNIEDRDFLLGQPQSQRPTTRLGTQYTTPFINPYRQAFPQGETELANGMLVNQYAPIKAPELARDAWAEESALNPNTSERSKGLETYYRVAGQDYMVGDKEGLAKPFYTPEVILPESLARKTPMYFEGSGGISPNSYRIAGSTSKPGGYNEFNEVMDKGVKVSRRLDRLYGLSDLAAETPMVGDIPARTADLIKMNRYDNGIKIAQPVGNIFEYIQPDVLDEIVDAERAAERMGGTYRRLAGKREQGVMEALGIYDEPPAGELTSYVLDEALEPYYLSDYTKNPNRARVQERTRVKTPKGVKTRLATESIDPQEFPSLVEPFNQAQYTRDLVDRGRFVEDYVRDEGKLGEATYTKVRTPIGSILIDTQLGIPIAKAPASSFNPATQREAIVNVGGAEVTTPKNITYLQPARPSRIANGVANWQAPESLVTGRVGRQVPIENIPELPINTGYPMTVFNPLGGIYGPSTPVRKAVLPARDLPIANGQVLYPNSGIGPINTGLKPKPTIGELFGFTALTPEGLAKYRDMS